MLINVKGLLWSHLMCAFGLAAVSVVRFDL